MKIGVVGLGFVGLSLASVLASKNYKVIGIDIDKKKCQDISNGITPFYEPNLERILKIGLKKGLELSNDYSLIHDCDYVFVTVGTPQKSDGSIELRMMETAIKTIGKNLHRNNKNQIIFIKSTVIPGTVKDRILPILERESKKKAGKEFGLISNPEFLQESNAINDTKFPHVVILGGYKTKYMRKAKKFFEKLHPKTPIIITNHQTAEMIKYANNSFLATKISFINQLSNICQNIPGANIDDVAKTIGLDPRIGKEFLNAGPGYGGSCLPKDMKALINFSKKTGASPVLLNAVEEINTNQIDQIISLLKKELGNLSKKKITILGTAFKPNTDDVRDSIAIELIKKLLRRKSNITIHDPKAITNTRKLFGNKINYSQSIQDALNGSHCTIIMTHWKQYERLGNNEIKRMRKKLVIDCRRILVKKQLNANYYAIGIGNR